MELRDLILPSFIKRKGKLKKGEEREKRGERKRNSNRVKLARTNGRGRKGAKGKTRGRKMNWEVLTATREIEQINNS